MLRPKTAAEASHVAHFAAIEAHALALIAQHIPGWCFAFNRQRRTLGLCRYRERRIELSRHHAARGSLADAETTLIHEIAHALAGPNTGHGPSWKAQMRALGAEPVVTAKVATEPHDFLWAIVHRHEQTLTWVGGRYRRPQRAAQWYVRGQPHTLGHLFVCRTAEFQQWQRGELTLAQVNLRQ